MRRKLVAAPVRRTITRPRFFFGWWVSNFIGDYYRGEEPITELWFFTKRGAEKWVRENA